MIPAPAALAETVESDFVLIRPTDVVEEDLYAVANRAEIAGRVEGDVVLVAAGEVKVSGTVTGDLTVIASSVVITGTVEGSVRFLARTVTISGEVGDDVVGPTWEYGSDGTVGRDVVVWAGHGRLGGEVGRDVEGRGRTLIIDGTVAGDVEVTTGVLEVGEDARVEGSIRYVSEHDATVAEGVEADLIHRRPLPVNVRVRGLLILLAVLGWIAMVAAGLSMMWAAPGPTVRAAQRLRRRPLASLVAGVVLVSIPFVLTGLTGLGFSRARPEVALPLVVAVLPVLFALFGILFFALLVAPAPSAMMLMSTVMGRRTPHARLVVGMVLIGLVGAVPLVGAIVLGMVLCAGLGSWWLTDRDAEADKAASAISD